MAGWFVGPIMEKIINNCSDYLEDQVGWQTGMKEVLERLRENHPKIQAVVFAANQAQIISDQNSALNKWIWQLRDAIDEADDVLDEFEYVKHQEQLPKNMKLKQKPHPNGLEDLVPPQNKKQLTKNTEGTEKRKFTSFPFESPRKTLKIGESGLKIDLSLKGLEESLQKLDYIKHKEQLTENTKETKEKMVTSLPYERAFENFKIRERDTKIVPNLKQLEEAVKKLDKVSADVITFLPLLDCAKQEQKEQKVDFYRTRETGYSPRNDLIGRRKEKEFVMEWLRNPSNGHWGNSLLSIVGHGGIGKTNLLQHVYKDDEITKLFDLKMWVCVSNNFDVKKVIADMLECLKNERPRLETPVALLRLLNNEVMSKKFLLVLDDIWEEEENRDISKWENVLAPLSYGSLGSKILVTTRMDSVAMKIANVIKTKTEIYKLEGLEEDECLQLLNSHAFAGLEKELVMEWLRNPSLGYQTTWYRNISLLCIMGHGGLGKTTFLQQIYEDERTKEFDLKMWVCVSKKFDVKKVIADMLEYLDKKKKKPDLDSLDALQGRLQIAVRRKRFLLILDDIWVEEENRDISKWEKVLAPLAYGKIGSRILATTQKESFAMMIATVIKKKTGIFKLGGLEEDHCLQLLNSHAFVGVENLLDDYKKLRVIAGEIVKKLLRSPLAAKVIGGVLNDNLDERHWREVLESNLLDQNSIYSILRLSYILLPNNLQNCFAFCCFFPQDHKFDKDDLVRMWIALGFIQPSQGMIMEDIGGRYFDILIKKTLFDMVGDDYKMHDLIHESASKFFAEEYGELVDDEHSSLKISETIRHLSVQTINPSIIKKIGQFKYLHSLFLFYNASNQDLCSALVGIFNASRSLRLLYIDPSIGLNKIPFEIVNLIHLRYLKIGRFNVSILPRSLSILYHLQYIICDGLRPLNEVHFFPRDMNNLSNLRYLQLFGGFISLSICGIGKLKFLQELDMFDLRDMSGYRIGELENMNDLCKLGINRLENVKEAEEARNAQLCEKRRLADLNLCWSNTDSRNIDLYENILDNLEPPKCLRNLRIERYMGARSAIWMNDVNLISNLEKIELKFCSEWETLPPFGQLPYLKSLTLSKMPKVKYLESTVNGNDRYHPFPLLEELHISELELLEDWFEAGVAAEDAECFFPSLIQLEIHDCPKLKERYGDGGSDLRKIAHIQNIHI